MKKLAAIAAAVAALCSWGQEEDYFPGRIYTDAPDGKLVTADQIAGTDIEGNETRLEDDTLPTNAVLLDEQGRLPAVDGSQLTGLPTGGGGTTDGVVIEGSVAQGTLRLVRSQGGDVVIPGFADVVVVPDANVTQIGGGVNHIEFLNTANPVDGTIYHWISETTTTGSVQIRIGTGDYTVFKAGEGVGTFTLLDGGEFENTIPQQVTFEGGALFWTGTLLGTAASEDVGTGAGDLVVLNAGGKFNPEQLGTGTPDDTNFLRGDGQYVNLPEQLHLTQGAVDGNGSIQATLNDGSTVDFAGSTYDGRVTDGSFADGTLSLTGTRNLSSDIGGFNAENIPTNTGAWPPGPLGANDDDAQSALQTLAVAVQENTNQNISQSLLLHYVAHQDANNFNSGRRIRYTGNCYEAESDVTIHDARMKLRIQGTGGIENLRGWIAKTIHNVETDSYIVPVSNPEVVQATLSNDGVVYHSLLDTPEEAGDRVIHMRFGEGFELGIDDRFTILLQFQTQSDDLTIEGGLVGGQIPQNQHIGVDDYPHSTIEWRARCAQQPEGELGVDTGFNLNQGTGVAAFTEIDYTVPIYGLLTLRSDGSEVYHGPADLNATGGLVVGPRTATRGGEIRLGNFTGLTNIASSAIDDHDVVAIHHRDDDSIHGMTFGEIAARLADGTTITSSAGTLSTLGGGTGGGDGDFTLATLTQALNGDGTDDLALVTPIAGDAANQDIMLIWDRSMNALRRTGLGDLAAQISANPFQGASTYTDTIAPGDFLLFRDISLGVNHALTAEELYGGMFDIAGLHQTSPSNDARIVIKDGTLLRYVRWDQFNQGGGGGSFTPSQANLYDAVKAILVPGTNTTLTENDTANTIAVNGQAGGSGGGSGKTTLIERDGVGLTATLQVINDALGNPVTIQHDTEYEILVYMEGGNRDGGIAYAQVPGSELRDTVNSGDFLIPLAENRRIVADVSAPDDFHFRLAVQNATGLAGNAYVRLSTVEAGGGGMGSNDGVVDAGSVTGTTLTLERTVGDDVVITGLPTGGGGNPFAGLGISHDAPDLAADLMIWRDSDAGVNRAYDFDFLRSSVFNFDLHDDVTEVNAVLSATDRLLTSAEDLNGTPHQYTTVSGLFNGMRDVIGTGTDIEGVDTFAYFDENTFGDPIRRYAVTGFLNDFDSIVPTGSIDTADYLYFTNVSNPDTPLEKLTTEDFVGAIPRLVGDVMGTLADVDEFLAFDVSNSNDVKRINAAAVSDYVGGQVITDSIIDYATPSNESDELAASRQAIAEALDALSATIPVDATTVVANPGGTALNRLSTVAIGPESFQLEGDDVELGYQDTGVTSARNFITLNSVGHAIVPAFAGLQSGISAANLEDTDEMIIGNSGSAFAPHSTTLGELRTFLGSGGGTPGSPVHIVDDAAMLNSNNQVLAEITFTHTHTVSADYTYDFEIREDADDTNDATIYFSVSGRALFALPAKASNAAADFEDALAIKIPRIGAASGLDLFAHENMYIFRRLGGGFWMGTRSNNQGAALVDVWAIPR